MKLVHLLEAAKTDAELYAIAIAVGKREFGSSRQGFIHENSLKHVYRLTAQKPDMVDTYGWVFYPSDPKKFVEYSDKSYKNIPPDVDGLVYSADASGNMFIVSGSKAKAKTTSPFLSVIKNADFGDWKVEHIDVHPTITVYLRNQKLKTYDTAKARIKIQANGKWDAHAHRYDSPRDGTQGGEKKDSKFTVEKLQAWLDEVTKKFK